MNVEQILGKNGLLGKKSRYIGPGEVEYKIKNNQIKLSVSYRGNMGSNLSTVNEGLKLITSLDDTLDLLDALPNLAKQEGGWPDYSWHKVWLYQSDAKVSKKCEKKYGGVE